MRAIFISSIIIFFILGSIIIPNGYSESFWKEIKIIDGGIMTEIENNTSKVIIFDFKIKNTSKQQIEISSDKIYLTDTNGNYYSSIDPNYGEEIKFKSNNLGYLYCENKDVILSPGLTKVMDELCFEIPKNIRPNMIIVANEDREDRKYSWIEYKETTKQLNKFKDKSDSSNKSSDVSTEKKYYDKFLNLEVKYDALLREKNNFEEENDRLDSKIKRLERSIEQKNSSIQSLKNIKNSLDTSNNEQNLDKDKQIQELEKEVENKNLVIMEQIKVIQQLAMNFKKTVSEYFFDHFGIS
jgi:hypothetical protein